VRLAGPWTRLIRDPADLIRLSFLLGAAVLLAFGEWGYAVRVFLTFVVCIVPRLIGTALAFDVAFGLAMSLQAWGNVSRLFWTWHFYHNVVHLVLTMSTAALVYFLLVFLRLVPDLSAQTRRTQKAGIAVLAFAIGSSVNGVYEEYEWFADNVLGAHLLENYSHDVHDLLFGGIGSVAAGLWLAAWSAGRWRTRRRADDDPLSAFRAKLDRRMERGVHDRGHAPSWYRRHCVSTPRSPFHSQLISRAVFGDWSRLVRDANDVARLSLLVGLAISLSDGNWDRVARFAVTFVASAAVRRLRPPRLFEVLFNAALMSQAWGDFSGAFATVPGYDDWTNFVVPLGCTPILYVMLVRAGVFPELADQPRVHRHVAVFIAALCLGFCTGIYYELYVWLANRYLGGEIAVGWDGLTRRLTLGWLGSAAGAAMLLAWDAYGWGTRRRRSPVSPVASRQRS
jgi:hypothetical protein